MEKELLSIVHRCTRFDQCVYGREVIIQTDHKTLENIFKKPLYYFKHPSDYSECCFNYRDYWSDYFVLRQLANTTSITIIKSFKNPFARHGIPGTLYSDNGSQFTLRYFEQFASDWQFDHQTAWHHYPQSNDADRKCCQDKPSRRQVDNPDLTNLDWRNKPSASIGTSPVQGLFGTQSCQMLGHCCNPRLWQVLRTSRKKEKQTNNTTTTEGPES
ncbi:hypothetical protein ACROYT_G005433 [Oculina patagonica]